MKDLRAFVSDFFGGKNEGKLQEKTVSDVEVIPFSHCGYAGGGMVKDAYPSRPFFHVTAALEDSFVTTKLLEN